MHAKHARTASDAQRRDRTPDIRSGFQAMYKTVQMVHHGKVALPLLIYLLFKLAVIFAYSMGGAGPLDAVWALVLPGKVAESLRHYPQHLLLLPQVMGRLDIALDVLVHVIAQGATVILVAAVYQNRRASLTDGFGRTMRAYGHLVGVMVAATALILAATRLPLLPSLLGSNIGSRTIVTGAGTILGLVVQAFFLYAVPSVLLRGRTALRAIWESFLLSKRRYLLALTLAVVPFIITLPTTLLSFKAQAISLRLFPELLIHTQILGEVMQLIASYLLVGSVTIRFVEETGSAPEKDSGRPAAEEEGDR